MLHYILCLYCLIIILRIFFILQVGIDSATIQDPIDTDPFKNKSKAGFIKKYASVDLVSTIIFILNYAHFNAI